MSIEAANKLREAKHLLVIYKNSDRREKQVPVVVEPEAIVDKIPPSEEQLEWQSAIDAINELKALGASKKQLKEWTETANTLQGLLWQSELNDLNYLIETGEGDPRISKWQEMAEHLEKLLAFNG
jgi:hypothetical protein